MGLLGGIGALNDHMDQNEFRPHLHRATYPSLRKLIQDCWKNDPTERPTFDEIIKRMGGTIIEEILVLDEPDFTIEDNYEEENYDDATNAACGASGSNNRLNRFDSNAIADAIDKANKFEAENKKLKKLVSQYENEIEQIPELSKRGGGGRAR